MHGSWVSGLKLSKPWKPRRSDSATARASDLPSKLLLLSAPNFVAPKIVVVRLMSSYGALAKDSVMPSSPDVRRELPAMDAILKKGIL